MASLYQKDSIYWLQYYRNGKRYQESLKTKSRKEAKYFLFKKEAELIENRFKIPNGQIDVWQTLDRYNQSGKYEKSPKTVYDDNIRITHYLKHSNIKIISEINANSLKDYLHYRFEEDKPIGFNTANHIIVNLKTFLNWVQVQGLIKENPLLKYKPYKLEEKPPNALTKEEMFSILAKSKNTPIYRSLAIAFYTGMRKGELLRLRLEDIDFINKVIIVYKSKSRKFRQIPLNDKLANILKNTKDLEFKEERRKIRRIAKDNHIKFGWHTCRHTFASLLLQSGVSIYKVKEYLGHSTTKTTEIYAHLQPNKDNDINKI